MKTKFSIAFFINFLLLVSVSVAQCPMCKKSAESSDMSAGINLGVLYLLIIPIVLVSAVIVIYLRNKENFR